MALARYTDTFWYPNGQIAAGVPASVFPESSSAFATLWADSAGTVPLANPLPTTGTGLLDFWAEAGNYWVHLDTETFPVTVGMSQEQADLSTGVASGGELNASLVNPLAVDIGPTDGYIVDYLAGTQAEPVITRVKTSAQTVALDAGALARAVTWWLLDTTGAVIQQAAKPDAAQFRTHVVLGVTAFDGATIIVDQSLPVILPGQANQMVDLLESLGPFNIAGNRITANGANLQLDQSAGTTFARAFNHFAGPTLTNNPHINTTQAQSPADFIRITQTTTVTPALTNVLDVANYDNGGVITPIGGGANTSSIHRVYLFPNNDPQRQLVVQYGQRTYANLSAAVNAVGAGTFVENPFFIQGNGALIAYIAAIRSATNLSDPTQATIITAGKFSTP